MEENEYIKTGFTELDKLLQGGLKKGNLYLIAARPAVGKTSLAMNIITNVGLFTEKTCAIYSIDIPKEELELRMFCSVSGVSLYKALNDELTTDDWIKLEEEKNKVKKSKINIVFSETLSDEEVINECRKVKREQGLDIVMIDYIQLMTTTDSEGMLSCSLMCSAISRRLKLLAKELDVAIILLSQLPRRIEERTNHRSLLSDLRQYGTLEVNADVVMFIYNPYTYEKYISSKNGIVELIVARNRNGKEGTVKLKFKQECLRFENLDNKVEL